MITQEQVLDIAKETLYLIILNSMPLLLVSMVIGLVISIFQTVTSIQEQTLTFVPKIICVFIALMIIGSWILTNLTNFTTELWNDFTRYVG